MAAAARLALRARPLSRPNPGVAALVVHHGRVIARGWTQAGGRPHAEAMALAGLAPEVLAEATLYVTLEPCAHQSARGPACADLILAARPARVVIGQIDPDPRTAGEGIARLEAAGIETRLLADPASAASLAGFLTRQRLRRPWVTLKLATSLDGCIAMADGTSQWITGEPARAHVHAQRARHDAILVGGGTWRTDSPRLDVRLTGLAARSPQRVVLTRGASPADGVVALPSPQAIATLEGVQYLYVEGGAETAAAFLAADLVDELHLYTAPILIGDGRRALGALGLTSLTEAHGRWSLAERRQLGSDSFAAYWRTRTT
ncbi:bifunctional diaminohydroxyphosphoribosylaminopyrimidine deaminase/5-amino-6-(5-phosphoribosylamino)uracil reductase RibD [Porphyrobacter sp. ULC335]|uniref:bifunctional diaminohydroxyphosphoribosylaminopyrimidine deaminase/5-amino-6-(5-phosphoribosylamino)uracil reductase RibD n=1 Tax=Porphyrobacter sp. ULC335 TaxID=2854260 RepID=UPI00221EAF63|nr:bifunctional diaminohydroxyphosphoribosylaminopyrimidine deaminase/5-amino-6-(5-phosphoribosylamino)uracil reductase RibD [Porphyrobacter sp. ULC335]UYV15682.1 bifunctional diaminohydroxyphosphoribosylaminopyrimidine deaminase/5-amino-6-(5-phosphoribosylamino)uracil reductase RibD [Porphyrobacter sp. ULC335]